MEGGRGGEEKGENFSSPPSPSPILNPSTSPLKSLFDSSQLSGSINVQDGGRTSFLKTIHGSRSKIRLLCRLGIIKKLSVKKFRPPPSLFIFIDGCPSRPSTMTATATNRNVNYLPWRCTTTAWNVLISRSMEGLNIRQRFLFLFLIFDRDLWNLSPEKRTSPASGKLNEME